MTTTTSLAVQSWALYAIATSLVVLRIIFRQNTLRSLENLQADDWLMIIVLVPFTAAIVLANQSSGDQSARDRKARYVLEELHIITNWMVKACLLVLYWRIFPVNSELWKRRALQAISISCCLAFVIVQSSLFAWCRPVGTSWDKLAANSQCAWYHGHTAVTLGPTVLSTVLIMIVPIPFISTPRRLLLTLLLLLGILVLSAGIISRVTILTRPTSLVYLHWYTTESSLSIILANLPFLTSLVVSAAPARIRNISQSLKSPSCTTLGQWPRSRRGSWVSYTLPPRRVSRLYSSRTTLSTLPSPLEAGTMHGWSKLDPRNSSSSQQSAIDERRTGPALTSREQWSPVYKTRLSGGLAEMGHVSTDGTERWPICSRGM